MSRREGVVTSIRESADAGKPPNNKVPALTCEVRCFWPDTVTDYDVVSIIHRAAEQAIREAMEKRLNEHA